MCSMYDFVITLKMALYLVILGEWEKAVMSTIDVENKFWLW